MKVFLLHSDRDVGWGAERPPAQEAVTRDLGVDAVIEAMAGGDEYLADIARRVAFLPLTDPRDIAHRQQVLADCLAHPDVVRQLYDLARQALRSARSVRIGLLWRDSPDTLLRRSVEVLELMRESLRRLRSLADEHADSFSSDGFTRFFAMLSDELDEEYLATIEEHLANLRMPDGLTMSAELGTGNKGVRHVLHRPPHLRWWERWTGMGGTGYSFEIHPRDEAGARALRDLESRGVNLAANVLAQSVDHVLSFWRMMQAELAFCLGCMNLHQHLTDKGEPVCWPRPHPVGERVLSARGLYDVGLSLRTADRTVGNDVDGDRTDLIMVTGANEGGKSTFLRSVGLAQLMMQAGMFVGATAFAADAATGLFTHFKREEDPTMVHGKLDEELERMSRVADGLAPGAVLLCNESFAATNEREGSQIARQIVRAATESGVKVVFVTHLYDLAHGLYEDGADTTLFLRAERLPDGRRTFRVVPGEPLPTSYGRDSYRRVFADAGGARGDGHAHHALADVRHNASAT